LDGCLFPITLPVTDGLGENAAGALNALVPVPASGGGRRPCARGLSIRTSLFPYSTVAVWSSPSKFARRSIRVRGCGRRYPSCGWGALSRGRRFTYGCSRHVRQLGYPLLTPSTVAPESLFERLRSKEALFVGRVSMGSREQPCGGSPRALGGVFDSFEGYVAQCAEALLMFVVEGGPKALISWFHVRVATYSRWSKRHL